MQSNQINQNIQHNTNFNIQSNQHNQNINNNDNYTFQNNQNKHRLFTPIRHNSTSITIFCKLLACRKSLERKSFG